MDLIREILASHESGISRDGLLAWARLRGNPQMTDEELDAVLAAMGDEVVDVQGFLYLRQFAPSSSSASVPPPPSPPAWGAAAEAPPATPGGLDAGTPGWSPPDGAASLAADQPAWATPEQPDWSPPAQPTSNRRTMLVAAVGVGLFVVMAFGASLALRDSDEAAAPAVPTPTAGTVIGADSLAVGDCIVLPSEDQFDEIRRLACTEPHDGEVFFVGDHPDGEFPSDDAFEAYVDAQCVPTFTTYTGSEFYEQDVLDIGWFTPTASAWDRGDREIVCHLTPVDGSQTDRSWAGGNP